MFLIFIICPKNPQKVLYEPKLKPHVLFKKSSLNTQNMILALLECEFFPREYFLWIFKACYAYEKHCLMSKESFHIIFGTTRHLQVDSREERINFVDFSKSHSRRVKIQFGVSKKGFFESA